MQSSCCQETSAAACSLSAPQQQQRTRELEPLLSGVAEVRELDTGYALWFGSARTLGLKRSARLVRELADFIETERRCCPFVTYRLELERNAGPVVLSLTGDSEAKPILDEFAEHVRALPKTTARRVGLPLNRAKALVLLGSLGVVVCCALPLLGVALAASTLAGLTALDHAALGLLGAGVILLIGAVRTRHKT